jgi:hypothetical protein
LTGAKLPLGTLTVTSGQSSCGGAHSCQIEFNVSCPDVKDAARGQLYVTNAEGSTRGMVVITLGGLGTDHEGASLDFIRSLAGQGFDTVVVNWVDSWLQAASGEQVGPKRLACRAATAVKWTYDNLYKQSGVSAPALGACGFCLTGNSGGASQIGYMLSFYGIAGIVNAAIMSGGPPHAALAKGCLRDTGFAYDGRSAQIIDYSYGVLSGTNGPCQNHDQSFSGRWDADSIETGGVYDFPKTRIVFIFVSGDPTPGPAHGEIYLAALRAGGSRLVSSQTIPGTTHTIEAFPGGREALQSAIEGQG